jgi:transcription initiation factor TFIID subunit 13
VIDLTANESQNSSSSSQSHSQPQPQKKKKYFHRELRYMMHGFGDDPNPYNETVELIDDLVVQFITEMSAKAMEIGKKGKITVDDILYLTRNDHKKHARVKDLLAMNEELKQAKKYFENAQENI